MTRILAIVLTVLALGIITGPWALNQEMIYLLVLIVAILGASGYGWVVMYARHRFAWPFWVMTLLLSPFWYGVWALFKFRFGRVPYTA